MEHRILKILIALLVSSLIFLFNDYVVLGKFYFYVITTWLALDILIKKQIELIHVWFGAFIYIILSEVFWTNFPTNEYTCQALQFLILSNNTIFILYTLFKANKKLKETQRIIRFEKYYTSQYAYIFLMFTTLFYIGFRLPGAIIAFRFGRIQALTMMSQHGLLLTSLLNALGFVLPAVIAYYFLFIKQTRVRTPLLFSLPIFIILFMYGTRFPLLFSVLGFAFVLQNKFMKQASKRTYIYLFISLAALLGTTEIMKQVRVGDIDVNNIANLRESAKAVDPPTYFSKYMSPEGILDMTSLMFAYFRKNDHLYGESSSFILYFWVPRQLWPDKPEMLGFWFIREYRQGFASGHSASFGFTGDFYADFGWFALIPIAGLGGLLGIAENYKNKKFKTGGFGIIIGAMIFPYVFFFVRSPITATINFLGILVIYQISKSLIILKPKA